MNHFTAQHRLLTTTAAALFVVATAAPAMAVPIPGPPLGSGSAAGTVGVRTVTDHGTATTCPLSRVGTQLVRCDNLTGNGVEAPLWIPQA